MYCYVPDVTRNNSFFTEQHAKADVLVKLRKEAPKYEGTTNRVLLSFASDPYQPLDLALQLTCQVITILQKYGIPFQVLTKGGLRAQRDFPLYTTQDAFAVTLTFVKGDEWKKYEPGAAQPTDRIESLRTAKYQFGIETWVSLEPVIDARQSLEAIERTHEFVDHYKIGKMNRVTVNVNCRAFALEAIRLCNKYGKDYYIKKDLAAFLNQGEFRNTDRRRSDWRALCK